MSRKNLSTGTPWESLVAYSRAVRVGDQIFVSGTTASNESGQTMAVGDAYGQACYIIQKIEAALIELGAELSDVVRTRMFVTDVRLWEAVGKSHEEAFREIRPASTLVEVSRLVNPDHLVEIEVDAVIAPREQ